MENKNRIIASMGWKYMERLGVQGIQFLLQICLARLLSPEDYGTLALLLVFINIAAVFVQNGFALALVQKIDVDEKSYSSAFYICFFIATFSYMFLFAVAPYISNFYGRGELTSYLRFLGVILFPGAYNAIQNAIIQKKLLFKKMFFASIATVFLSGIVAIYFALNQYGTWTLIIYQIVYNFCICVFSMGVVRWIPKCYFSFERSKELFHFGSKLLLSSLINVLYGNLRSLVIGKRFSSEALGLFNRGEQLPNLLVTNISGSMQSVLFPVYATEQMNRERLRSLIRKSIKISSFLLFPMMLGMVAVSEPLVSILFGEKWMLCVPIMRILCLEYVFYPMHTINLQAINALGRSDIYLKLEVMKKIIGILILYLSVKNGIYGIAIGAVVTSIISVFINSYPNKKLLNYSYIQQIRDSIPSLLLSSIMFLAIFPISFLQINKMLILVLQIFAGGAIYTMLALAFHLEEMETLKTILGSLLREK